MKNKPPSDYEKYHNLLEGYDYEPKKTFNGFTLFFKDKFSRLVIGSATFEYDPKSKSKWRVTIKEVNEGYYITLTEPIGNLGIFITAIYLIMTLTSGEFDEICFMKKLWKNLVRVKEYKL